MRTKILTAAILALSAAGVQAAEKPLKILLVNDDGCQSVGTTSLQEKLAAKGYDVWMVAPATNQSGMGRQSPLRRVRSLMSKKPLTNATASRERRPTRWISACGAC